MAHGGNAATGRGPACSPSSGHPSARRGRSAGAGARHSAAPAGQARPLQKPSLSPCFPSKKAVGSFTEKVFGEKECYFTRSNSVFLNREAFLLRIGSPKPSSSQADPYLTDSLNHSFAHEERRVFLSRQHTLEETAVTKTTTKKKK